VPRYSRPLFWVNAALAWTAVGVSLSMALSGYYVDTVNPAKATLLGNTAAGVDTPLERFLDWITYFTILSNIVVAVVVTVLALRPAVFTSSGRSGGVWRALRLDSVLMISITGVVYNLLLASGGKTGWDFVSNALLHVLTPIVTVVVWLIAGPRGLIHAGTIPSALVLPLLWAAFALVRGAAIGAYPYPFLDVATNGLGAVLGFIAGIVAVAVALAFALMGIDALIRRRGRRS
jgi:hypothetical protein